MSGLDDRQIETFYKQGYLVVENVLDEKLLLSIEAEYSALLEREAGILFSLGKVPSTYANLPFGQRYTTLLAQAPALFERINISLPLTSQGMPPDAKVHTGAAVFAMLTHPALLDVMASLIGQEIESNPVQHVRIKPPVRAVPESLAGLSYVGKTTWHQDMGALMDEANDTELVTAWVAVTDATPKNGCLCVVPQSHSSGRLTLHCPGKGIAAENYIPASLLAGGAMRQRVQALPVRRGGVVLLNRFTQHCALPNKSDDIRWSFDLRYNPVGQPSGRPAFPSFVARSRQHPKRVTTNARDWTAMWERARNSILSGAYRGPIFNAERWRKYSDSPVCA